MIDAEMLDTSNEWSLNVYDNGQSVATLTDSGTFQFNMDQSTDIDNLYITMLFEDPTVSKSNQLDKIQYTSPSRLFEITSARNVVILP